MPTTTTGTLVIGAGQAGLAASRCLHDRGRDHLVVDRGRAGHRWRAERWDSLRLLTPNWLTRLPGFRYDGDDPTGFMTAREAAAFFDRYAASFGAPVLDGAGVAQVERRGPGFVARTERGDVEAEDVVVATGWCDRTRLPAAARSLHPRLAQVTAADYRRPGDLPEGGVLVVGASASGIQLADELHGSGRPVTLAVGSHIRMPRSYRGFDSFWWLDRTGALDETVDDIGDPGAVSADRYEPALQLAGRPDHRSLDLPTLEAAGVRLVGRVVAGGGRIVHLAPDLAATVDAADERMRRTLRRFDDAADRLGLGSEVLDAEPVATISPATAAEAPTTIDLRRDGIRSVVWATGYRRSYDWLRLPVLDERGEIRQRRGVTAVPGAYVLGLKFQHHRNSHFIDGVGRDAAFVADHIVARHRGGDHDRGGPHGRQHVHQLVHRRAGDPAGR